MTATFKLALPRFVFPHSYIPPFGEPYHWESEESGLLEDAIAAWGQGIKLDRQQFWILKNYLLHWLFAPCWQKDLYELRLDAMAITDSKEMEAILTRAFQVGIKPW
jgi:hypothetical protein